MNIVRFKDRDVELTKDEYEALDGWKIRIMIEVLVDISLRSTKIVDEFHKINKMGLEEYDNDDEIHRILVKDRPHEYILQLVEDAKAIIHDIQEFDFRKFGSVLNDLIRLSGHKTSFIGFLDKKIKSLNDTLPELAEDIEAYS